MIVSYVHGLVVDSTRLSVTEDATSVSFAHFQGGSDKAEKQRYQDWATSVIGTCMVFLLDSFTSNKSCSGNYPINSAQGDVVNGTTILQHFDNPAEEDELVVCKAVDDYFRTAWGRFYRPIPYVLAHSCRAQREFWPRRRC